MTTLLVSLLVLALFAAVALVTTWRLRRGREIVEDWARREGYDLVSVERCWIWRGPFFLRSGDQHAVYQVHVRDAEGGSRQAYVRCGSWVFGMMSDQVSVEWT